MARYLTVVQGLKIDSQRVTASDRIIDKVKLLSIPILRSFTYNTITNDGLCRAEEEEEEEARPAQLTT